MSRSPFAWILGESEGRSIVRDLRNGRAGAVVRLGLSLAAAGLCLVPAFCVLGLLEVGGGRVQDQHVGMAMAITALLWGACLVALWWSYRRFRHAIRALVAVIAVWAFVVPAAVTVAETVFPPEFFVAALIIAGVALTVVIVAVTMYHGSTGRRIIDATGAVRVECPACRYSLVGLSTTTCPECGTPFTIDEIIRAQGYQRDDDVEPPVPAEPTPDKTLAIAEPVVE